MTREIKFRGKPTSNIVNWFYGSLIVNKNGTCWIKTTDYEVNNDKVDLIPDKVIPETVGQFTGLKDKNGKEIYEGDIIKTKYGRLCVINMKCNESFIGFDVVPLEIINKAPDEYDILNSHNIEIVGNIYDNKNLLEK